MSKTSERQHSESEVVLEMIRYGFSKALTKEFLDSQCLNSQQFSLIVEETARQFVVHIELGIWGDRAEPIVISSPITWWDSFKERWFPDFLIELFPIRYRNTRIEGCLLYPSIKVIPNHETRLYVKVTEWDDSDFAKSRTVYEGGLDYDGGPKLDYHE